MRTCGPREFPRVELGVVQSYIPGCRPRMVGHVLSCRYVEFSTDQKSNLDAMTGAIAALEKGMGKAFLQGGSAGRLIKVRAGAWDP